MVRLEKIVIQGFKSFKRNVSISFPSGFSVITGPNGSGKCVTGDTLVQMADGSLERIDELVKRKLETNPTSSSNDGMVAQGDSTQIISLDTANMKAVAKPVDAFIKRTSPKRLVAITTRSGRRITATEYHPLFVLRDGNVQSIRADELKEGMRVAVPRTLHIQRGKSFHKLIDAITEEDRIYVPFKEEYRTSLLKARKESGLTLKGISRKIGVPLISLQGLINRQAVNFAHLTKILSFAGFDREGIMQAIPYVKSRIGGNAYKMVWENSPEFSRFLGYALAEGRLSTTSFQLWFTNGTREIVEDYANLAERLFGIKPSVKEYKPDCWDVIIYSHPIMRILSKFGMSYKGTIGKTVNNLFLENSSCQELAELINGLYSGDGYVSENSIEITTKSPDLAFRIQTILLRLGIASHVNKVVKVATNSGLSGLYHNIVVYGVDNSKKFYDRVKFVHLEKMRRTLALCGDKAVNPNTDLMEVNDLVKKTTRELGINVKSSKKIFPRIDSYVYNQCTPSRHGVSHLIENLFEPARLAGRESQSLLLLRKLCESHILWDEITSIEEVESREKWVYDLSVRDTHNFVANGFFVHNSNVGDSISFVIGKASSRVMRAKKSQELIFHGSRSKGAAEYAKVTLYFDNSDHVLPFKDDSVSISRRLNSRGVSTYRLNGKIATRQEILDVFSQAGVHANGHNIIQQGDVNQVVEMDSIERREIIDEISGISEYDEKKQKALQELEKIAEKVREAELILNEKFSILDKLQKERDTAVNYKSLESDLEKIRASVLWKEFSESEKTLEEVVKKAEEKEDENQRLEVEIKEYDAKLAEEENKMEQLTKDVLEASSQIEVTKSLSRVQSEMEIKKDRLESHRREIDRINVLIDRLSVTDRKYDPAVKAVTGHEGVLGIFADLVKVPKNYRVAFEVASGSHLNDIVVDSANNAVRCVNYLKQNKIGRARFLPLDKLNPFGKKALPAGAIGWMADLVHHEPKYTSAVEFVLGSTACVNDIEKAKHIFNSSRIRMVTLDGDLIESSGAIVGGFYRKREAGADISGYEAERKRIENEIDKLEADIVSLNKEMEILAAKEKKTKTISMERDRAKIDETLKKTRERRKEVYERRLILQQEIGKLNIQRARLEAKFDNLRVQIDQTGKKEDTSRLKPFIDLEISTLKGKERECIVQIESLGPVNMKAIDDYEIIKKEFDDFRGKVDRIIHEKNDIEGAISQIEEKRVGTFMATLDGIAKNFKLVYQELTGGEADLSLELPNQLDSGLAIRASPPGKRLINIDSMSGGEKTLTAFAFLFAIQRHKPTPFYILDEADAALDKVNSKRVAELIRKQAKLAQFIVISHNDHVVREADHIYGISMEDGESKVIAVELPKVEGRRTKTEGVTDAFNRTSPSVNETEKQAEKTVAQAPQTAGKNN